MRFGSCLDFSRAAFARDAGIEYAELNATKIAGLGEEEFGELCRQVDAGEIVTYSCNGLLPGDLRVTGEVDEAAVRAYVEKLFARLSRLGIRMIVFGSGKAKHIPEGFPREAAWAQLLAFGRLLSDEAAKYGATVVVEPLNRDEVNVIDSMEEGIRYVREVARDNFRLHADFYHMAKNGEPLALLDSCADILAHTHFAGPYAREIPTDDEYPFLFACLDRLRDIGYTGDVSFEGRAPKEGSVPLIAACLDRLRTYWNEER